MRKLSRKNQVEIAVLTVLYVIAAFLAYKTTIVTRMVLPRAHTQVEAEKGLSYALMEGDHIEQSFLYPQDELLSVGMEVSLNEDLRKEYVEDKDLDLGVLHLDILDGDGVSLMRADYPVYAMDDGQNLVASFPGTQTGWAGKKLTIVLDAEQIRAELGLSIGYTKERAEGTALIVNGKEHDGTFNIQTADRQFLYWKAWGVFGALLIYVLLLGSYLAIAVFRAKAESVFLFGGSLIAVLYLLLLPPLAAPDEEAHFKQAYHYSNILMGKGGAGEDTLCMDQEDFHAMQKFQTTPSLLEYDTIKETILKRGREDGVAEIHFSNTRAPAATYLPGIVGIALGRLLGLNGLLVIYLGRIFAIGVYLLTMYWFICLMPVYKTAAFLMALLPMTVQQCCSYSYDATVIELSFLYFAVLFGLFAQEGKIKKWQAALYACCIAVLSISKGGTYLPLCLLTLFLPVGRFSSPKKKWAFVGAMAAVSIAAFLSVTLSNILFVAAPTAEQTAKSYLAGESYGLSGFLSNPMEFVLLSVRTVFLNGDEMLETMLGTKLGWLDVYVSRLAVYGMLLLMALSALRRKDGARRPAFAEGRAFRLCSLAAALLSVGMVFVSMFISWTPRESTVISGIQGRYFLPLLPLCLTLPGTFPVTAKKDFSRISMFGAICLQCVAIYGILMSLERVL